MFTIINTYLNNWLQTGTYVDTYLILACWERDRNLVEMLCRGLKPPASSASSCFLSSSSKLFLNLSLLSGVKLRFSNVSFRNFSWKIKSKISMKINYTVESLKFMGPLFVDCFNFTVCWDVISCTVFSDTYKSNMTL